MAEADIRGPYPIRWDDWFWVWATWGVSESPSIGPFRSGSNLYICMRDSPYTLYFTIYKSTDSGATWTSVYSFDDFSNYTTATQKGAEEKLRIVRMGATTCEIYEFDMADDSMTLIDETWNPGDPNPYYFFPFWSYYNPVTAEDQAYYLVDNGGIRELWVRRYRAAAWQDAQKIRDAIAGNVNWRVGVVADSNGITHVFACAFPTFASTLGYQPILADGSLGTPQASIFSSLAGSLNLGRPCIINDTVALTINGLGKVVAGTPLSAPVFSNFGVGTGYPVTDLQVCGERADHLPATDGRLWWLQIYETGWARVNKVWSCTYDGTTLGDAQLIHDEDAYQSYPAIDPADQWLNYITPPVLLASGRWGFTALMVVPALEGGGEEEGTVYWEWQQAVAASSRGWAVIGRGIAGVKLSGAGGYGHCG